MRYEKGFGYQTEGNQNTEKQLATRTTRNERNEGRKSMLAIGTESNESISILACRRRNKKVLLGFSSNLSAPEGSEFGVTHETSQFRVDEFGG